MKEERTGGRKGKKDRTHDKRGGGRRIDGHTEKDTNTGNETKGNQFFIQKYCLVFSYKSLFIEYGDGE